MPLFFMLTGYLIDEEKIKTDNYLKQKYVSLMIPYMFYILIDTFILQQKLTLKALLQVIWGGRCITGVYWYTTCYLATLALFSFVKRHFSDKISKWVILIGGEIGIIESHFSEYINVLGVPGVPWNLDVALLALVYVSIGFYYKDIISRWLYLKENKYDVISMMISVLVIFFCIINYSSEPIYYFDMKYLHYKELISAIIIPCAFGIVVLRLIYWMEKMPLLIWLYNGLSYIGQMTMLIMFLHVPLNLWKEELGYGCVMYVFIGAGVPIVVTLLFGKFKTMQRLFGLTELKK